MTEPVTVTRSIDASADKVWEMVADVTRMHEWSPENTGAMWLKDATGPAVGATFRGTNARDNRKWKSVATVVDCVPGKVFSFHVKAVGLDVADWRYDFEPAGDGCIVAETWVDRRKGLMRVVGKTATGVSDRAAHNRAGMEQTLERLAAAAAAEAGNKPS